MTRITQPHVEHISLPTPVMAAALIPQNVIAEVLRVIVGGVGVGLVAGVATYWLARGLQVGLGWVWSVGFTAALLSMGVLAWLYSTENRLRNLYVLRQWEDAVGDKQSECEYLRKVIADRDQRIERLEDTLGDMENRADAGDYHSAVAAAANNPKTVVIRNTFTEQNKADAVRMIERWYLENKYPSETEMGWSRTRWEPAHRLLRRTGVVRLKHRTPQARQRNISWAVDRLNAHFGKLRGQPVDDPIDDDGDDDTDTPPA